MRFLVFCRWDGGNVPGRAASALRTSLVKLHFVHRPYGAFHVFDSHETFVERQVVSHCVLYKIIHRLNKQRKKRTKPTQSRGRLSIGEHDSMACIFSVSFCSFFLFLSFVCFFLFLIYCWYSVITTTTTKKTAIGDDDDGDDGDTTDTRWDETRMDEIFPVCLGERLNSRETFSLLSLCWLCFWSFRQVASCLLRRNVSLRDSQAITLKNDNIHC